MDGNLAMADGQVNENEHDSEMEIIFCTSPIHDMDGKCPIEKQKGCMNCSYMYDPNKRSNKQL